jgi:hypothetical protein
MFAMFLAVLLTTMVVQACGQQFAWFLDDVTILHHLMLRARVSSTCLMWLRQQGHPGLPVNRPAEDSDV